MLSRQGFRHFGPFFCYLVVLLSISILSSNWFFQTGLKTAFIQRVSFALYAVGTVLLHKAIMMLFRKQYALADKVLNTTLLLLAVWLVSPLWIGFSPMMIAICWMAPALMLCWSFVRCIQATCENFKKMDTSTYWGVAAVIALELGLFLEIKAVFVGQDLSPLSTSMMVSTIFLLLMAATRYFELLDTIYSLNQRIHLVQDMERARIARDLHDQVGQRLVALKLQLQIIFEKKPKLELAKENTNDLVKNINQCIVNIRQVLNGLKPSELTQGIVSALQEHIKQIHQNYDIDICIKVAPDLNQLDADTTENIHFICLEAINNAVKHAQATRVDLKLSKKSNLFQLTVQDNGKGFQQDHSISGIGLDSMRQRARILGADISIESTLGQGTTVRLNPT